MRVDEDAALTKLIYVSSILVNDFSISTKTTGSDASWINGKNKGNTRSIQNVVISGLLKSNEHGNGALQQKNQQKPIDSISLVN